MTRTQPNPTSAEGVRERLVEVLRLDLVGPRDGHELAAEVLPTAPSRWYLTGFLAPREGSMEANQDVDQDDELESAEKDADEATPAERAAATRARYPSSIGLSVLVATDVRELEAVVRWGDYEPAPVENQVHWRRSPKSGVVTLSLPPRTKTPLLVAVPGGDGIQVAVSVRPVVAEKGSAKGLRVVSVFVVNDRKPAGDEDRDLAYAFQVELELRTAAAFVARPNLRGLLRKDVDERIADLQFRDVHEWAVGHGVATTAVVQGGKCQVVRTEWIPQAEVERVEPVALDVVELQMEELAKLADAAEAKRKLAPLAEHYRAWIAQQASQLPTERLRVEVAEDLLRRAGCACDRIAAGIDTLSDPKVLQAFTLANKVMAVSARQRQGHQGQATSAPKWRPFQLAFVLLNLAAIAQPDHPDREVVDLLFFPTGGGKTEAYLGLAAFTLIHRRLQHPGIRSAGLSVLMRYTLRLLTLDQLSRAATLVCALELERKQRVDLLGDWPFEIGLWVGRAATPNRMGKAGESDRESARAKVVAFKNNERKGSPIPLENCPWCNAKFNQSSFRLLPSEKSKEPTDLRVYCSSRSCVFTRDIPLPIVAVDEPIYRRLPCFLIATVDKFAGMPWVGEVSGFFGKVDRYDGEGFYGPSATGRGDPLPGGSLPPPDLVIQDELHLISGPMGTIAGLYETALDWLCSRQVAGKWIRPKIVASTATVRRAETQIRALFGRERTDVFPPPGPDRRDSFFARTVAADQAPARRYLGIAAQGRSLKVVLLRVYRALLSGAQTLYAQAGGDRATVNPADPYMTVLGYFNSLRELGGSRRIVEDEVGPSVASYSSRKRINAETSDFTDRRIAREPVELTSRVPTNAVSEAKRKLACDHALDDHVDVALATNMISVGLDITRLGLMVVLGQPKTSAEYIQATSRVGRDRQKPGLVITLLNIHRPRDRSHFERFGFYHETFYRSVEASSVTPFSPRAMDRALAGTLVALARHGHVPMTAPLGAGAILSEQAKLAFVVQVLVERAERHAVLTPAERKRLIDRVTSRAKDLLDSWNRLAHEYDKTSTRLQYQTEVGSAQRLLYEPLHKDVPGLSAEQRKFRANRSMRDVEASVNLWTKTLDNQFVDYDDEDDQ